MPNLGTNPKAPGTEQGPGADSIIQFAKENLNRMRYFKRQFDQRRALFYRQYVGQRDSRMFPDNVTPRSNTFVPYPLSNVETLVSRVQDAFFAYMPWFECRGRTAQDDPMAETMELVLNHMVSQAGIVDVMEALVRNILIYGHAAVKVDWDFGTDNVIMPVMQPVVNPQTGQVYMDPQTSQPMQRMVGSQLFPVPRNRPKFTAIDVFDFMVDPDGGMAAQLTEMSWGQLRREAERYPDRYLPGAMEELARRLQDEKDPDVVIIRLAEFWNEIDGTVTLLTYGEDTEALSWKDLRASYRGTNISGFRRRAYGGPSVLLRHGPNPYSHSKVPILHTSFIKIPNETYGMGAIEIISDLTEGMNKFVNMIADNWNIGINKRYAYDTTADIDHESLNSFNTPGGKVGVNGNPGEVLMPLPIHTPEPGDYDILPLYKNLIELTSGISDFYSKGTGAPTGNRTATGINSIISEGNFRFKLFIRNLEIDVLQPLLQMCASMVQQFVTDPVEVELTDAPPMIPKWQQVTPQQLVGNVHFDLMAANYTENLVLRQRNLLSFAQLVGQSPFIDEYAAIQEMAKVFRIRNVVRILKTPQQVAMEQQAAQEQQVKMMMLESALNTESKARLAQSKPTPGGKEGRPAKPGTSPLKGAGLMGPIRSLAQSLGANGMGMGGGHEENHKVSAD